MNKMIYLTVIVMSLGVAGCMESTSEEPTQAQTDVFAVPSLTLSEADEPNQIEVIQDQPMVLPEELSLTLAECRTQALCNNLAIRATLMEPTLAAEQVGQEKAKFESVFTGGFDYNKYDTPSSSSINLEGSKGNNGSGEVAVTTPLQTGANVSVGLSESRNKSDSIDWIFNPSYETYLYFSLSQPLLRNAGVHTNTHSIRIAQYNHRISQSQARLEVTNLIQSVDQYYWILYAYQRELEVRRTQYDLAQAQLEQTQRLVEQGEVAQVEVIRAEAGLAERLEAIIVAQNKVKIQERALKRIINRPDLGIDSPTRILPVSDPQPRYYQLESEELIATALDNRMELLQLELQLAQDQSRIAYYRNQRLPDVTFNYRYGHPGLGQTRSDAYDLMGENRFGSHLLSLDMTIPLGNQAARHRLRYAVYQKSQRLATQASRKLMIKEEVLNAIDEVEAGWQRIMASRHNAVTAGRQYEAEKRQFELGLRTSTEVLDAQAKLADAQSSEILALANYQVSLEELAYVTGTLLGAAQIEWEPIVPAS